MCCIRKEGFVKDEFSVITYDLAEKASSDAALVDASRI